MAVQALALARAWEVLARGPVSAALVPGLALAVLAWAGRGLAAVVQVQVLEPWEPRPRLAAAAVEERESGWLEIRRNQLQVQRLSVPK